MNDLQEKIEKNFQIQKQTVWKGKVPDKINPILIQKFEKILLKSWELEELLKDQLVLANSEVLPLFSFEASPRYLIVKE